MTSLFPIHPQTSQILNVTPEALPKFHNQMQSMTSLNPIRPETSAILKVTPALISQANTIDDKSCPNLTTNIKKKNGYTGGSAQTPQANPNNDKSRPNSSTHIHNPSGYARGASQISQATLIDDKSHPKYDRKHPQLFRLHWRRCPKSTGKHK